VSLALHHTDIGDTGRRTVFLHGLFGQGRNFTQVAKALVPDLRSTLVDLPNHGRSPWTGSVDYLEVADVVADFVRTTYDDGPVHLVGHSMGGKVAMVLALRHPELLERLVVVDIAPAPSDGAGEFEHLLTSLTSVDLASLHRRADADAQLVGPIPDERVRGFLLQNLRAEGDGFRWQADLDLLLRELPTIAGWPDVQGRFDHPVLWLAGERSHYVRPEHEPLMRALFPRTVKVEVKGAGHWVHSEQPEAFTTALRVFLTAG
jgi:pimeloyl-ACP methyl ester carboxylesterase